jgi:hypothetical protein
VNKKDFIVQLLKDIQPSWPLPTSFKSNRPLVEQGIVMILMRHMTQNQAESSLTSLADTFEDWNETRVCQLQELSVHMKMGGRKDKAELNRMKKKAAFALKEYLQEVFQETHGLDLEFMREDIPTAAKLLIEMPVLGWSAGSTLLWLAGDENIPLHIGLVRFLDKLGLITRTTSMKKAASMIEPLVPKGDSLPFTIAMHEAISRWSDPDKPIFSEVEVLQKCAYGKKAHDDWKAARARLEAQRKKDAERQAALERKEAIAREREDALERKRLEGEAKRKEKEMEKKRREHERRLAVEAKKVAAKKAISDKKAAAIKKIAEKKVEAKKEATRKVAAKKAASKKAAADKKKASVKAAEAKKAAAQKAAVKKAASKKPVSKGGAKKKPVAAKKPVKKAAPKKAPPKKSPTKTVAARKANKKKPASKKSASIKPAARKATAKKATAKKAAKKAAVKKRPTARRR